MSWITEVATLLEKYAHGVPPQNNPDVEKHFGQIAQAAPSSQLSRGITEAFRSEQTPEFGDMISHLFDLSNPAQKAGILNSLLHARGNIRQLILRRLGLGGDSDAEGTSISPEQAEGLEPHTVREIAAEAEKSDPSVIDRAGDFYAQHPSLVRNVGSAALAIVLAKIANNTRAM